MTFQNSTLVTDITPLLLTACSSTRMLRRHEQVEPLDLALLKGNPIVATDQYRIEVVTCQLNNNDVAVHMVFNAIRQVSRWFFQTAHDNRNSNISCNSPTYVQQKAIQTKGIGVSNML